MSHDAIAAALALEGVSAGERLAAFSLASFANREHRAWPGTRVAAARAGLSRSQYLAARDGLVRRGLVVVERPGDGRGNSPVVALTFARSGPWFDDEINAALFEAVLSWSRSRRSARLLLAVLAALADEQFAVGRRSTEELRAAAQVADSTYRRARTALLESGEVELEIAGGGRSRTNRWVLRDPRAGDPEPVLAPRGRVASARAARPLLATVAGADAGGGEPRAARGAVVNGPGLSGVSVVNPAQDQTVTAGNSPGLSGVSRANPGRCRTVSRQTPPQTPSQTPPRHVRAGREPKNPRTCPPSPPDGGSLHDSILIEEAIVSARGRRRRRAVRVDLDEVRRGLRAPGVEDRDDWEQIRGRLRELVGESMFEIWLDRLELIAIDLSGTLVIAAPPSTFSWLRSRYGRVIARCAEEASRALRFAEEAERHVFASEGGVPSSSFGAVDINKREVS